MHIQYLENTRARGSLVLLMLTSSGKVDFSKSLYLALNRESTLDYTLSSPLSLGWYIFSVYDIEENGTVQGHIAYPAFSQNHFVMRNTPGWLHVFLFFELQVITHTHSNSWPDSFSIWCQQLQCHIFSRFGDICTVYPLP